MGLFETLRGLWATAYSTPSTSTFLRGDLTWAVPPSGSGGSGLSHAQVVGRAALGGF